MATINLTEQGGRLILTIEAENEGEDREIDRFGRFAKMLNCKIQNNPGCEYHTLEIMREL